MRFLTALLTLIKFSLIAVAHLLHLRRLFLRHAGASPIAVEPTTSQKRTVTTLRYSRPGASLSASGDPQALQKREPAGFSRPQLGQVITAEAYDDRGR